MALLLDNSLGYAYAHVVLSIRAARISYLYLLPGPGPLLPSCLGHPQNALHLEFGMLPVQEGTITQVVVDARRASAELLAPALTLSVLIGLSLGVEAARTGRSAGAGKALCDGQSLGLQRGRPGSPW